MYSETHTHILHAFVTILIKEVILFKTNYDNTKYGVLHCSVQ